MARTRPHCPGRGLPRRARPGGPRPSYATGRSGSSTRESDALATGLDAIGIGRGVRTVLMVRPSLEFFALTFALFKAGAVPVLIDPGMGIKNLGRCLAEAEPEAFIGIPKAQAARRLLGWGRETIRGRSPSAAPGRAAHLARMDVRNPGHAEEPCPDRPHAARTRRPRSCSPAGAPARPRGRSTPTRSSRPRCELFATLYGIEPGEIDLCTFPLFALFAPALGMTAIIPEMDATRPARVDPTKIIEAIEDFGVTNLFGSPALLRRVGDYGAGAGPEAADAPARDLGRCAGVRPRPRAVRGAARARRPDLHPLRRHRGPAGLLDRQRRDPGRDPPPDRPGRRRLRRPARSTAIAVEIIRISDEPIAAWSDDLAVPAGEVGEIAVQGPVVTRSYFNRPEATALAKIADPTGGGPLHRMGDLGYLDERGRIWFCGRKSHRVVTAGRDAVHHPLRGRLQHPPGGRAHRPGGGRARAARRGRCSASSRCGDRRGPTAIGSAANCSPSAQSRPHTGSIATILFHPSFPVDIRHNAKIFREKLAAWAARRLR